jgi:hypothetical protein
VKPVSDKLKLKKGKITLTLRTHSRCVYISEQDVEGVEQDVMRSSPASDSECEDNGSTVYLKSGRDVQVEEAPRLILRLLGWLEE